MSIKGNLVRFSIISILASVQVVGADWGAVKINTPPAAANPAVKANPAQLRQKNQLMAKKKQYQTLIQQVQQNMVKRPDLKAQLLQQLNNYKMHLSRLNAQLAQLNGQTNRIPPQNTRVAGADMNAVTAMAATFGLKSKAAVHFPELLKAKNDSEEKVIINKKLVKEGYRKSSRNDSVVIDDRLLFANGSAELRSAALRRVVNLATLYHQYGAQINRIVIRGHTNSLGNDAYNLQLSRNRSNKVKAELMRRGVPASAIISQGLGERELLPNINPDSHLNRRVEYGLVKR